MNDDIVGAKPKVYGIAGSSITNSFAGVSSGLKDRLADTEAPWGSGGNFNTTGYKQKWIDK